MLDRFGLVNLLRIPVIGGKELDLHVLYVEVTRRSGYEKVGFFFPTTSLWHLFFFNC